MSKYLNELISKAQIESDKYYFLKDLIDWKSVEEQLRKNPKLYSAGNKEDPLNILEALLRPNWQANPVYDPKINLMVLEEGLKTIYPILTERDKKQFSSKVSNLSNTAFWDTAPEIWFAANLYNKNQGIQLDFPLAKEKKGYTPPNADIAILDEKGNPIWIIDVFSPTLDKEKDYELIFDDGDGAIFLEFLPKKAINWIIRKIQIKYKNKFFAFSENFPTAKFALFLSVTKSDMISVHFDDTRIPIILDDRRLKECKNLEYAIAGRFQNNNGVLSLLKLAEFRGAL